MTLQSGLEAKFREGLISGDTEVLRDCLRTYATIDKMRDAENLFRVFVVKPYMEEVFVFPSINTWPI
jgi:conserved oligomeric Golgi complex subunit 2